MEGISRKMLNIVAHITNIVIEIVLFLLIIRLKNVVMNWVDQLRTLQEKQQKILNEINLELKKSKNIQ